MTEHNESIPEDHAPVLVRTGATNGRGVLQIDAWVAAYSGLLPARYCLSVM